MGDMRTWVVEHRFQSMRTASRGLARYEPPSTRRSGDGLQIGLAKRLIEAGKRNVGRPSEGAFRVPILWRFVPVPSIKPIVLTNAMRDARSDSKSERAKTNQA